MPALPIVIDLDKIRQGLSTDLELASRSLHSVGRGLTADLELATRSLHSAGHIILRRGTDNHIAEVVAVVATIAVSMGLLMYWGIKKEGSCDWRPRKK
ncbi:hypothetical protein SEUCBS139899_002187 [Sporothrix eucalyptigena]|uniref:Uncharacterized protein n=1 Tax=Sporothrix eucalyptigena TaxID=1812306 RepID=A0ABP0B4T8_9PEZI